MYYKARLLPGYDSSQVSTRMEKHIKDFSEVLVIFLCYKDIYILHHEAKAVLSYAQGAFAHLLKKLNCEDCMGLEKLELKYQFCSLSFINSSEGNLEVF